MTDGHGHHGHHDHAGHGHDHGHDHAHDDHAHDDHAHHHDHRALGRRALVAALLFNLGFLLVEAGVGLWTSSLALLSDAAHMLSDVLSLFIALMAAQARDRPRDTVATYGHARVAVLGGLVNATLALLASAWIVVEAIDRFQTPVDVLGLPVLVTAAIGLVVNVASAWWLHRSGDHGVNMRAALLHMLGDALGSVAAIIAGVVLVMGGPVMVDPVVSVLVGAIVVGSAVPLLRDAAHILLERAPRGLSLDAVRTTVAAVEGVADVVGLHVWSLDDGDVVASVVVVVTVDAVVDAAVIVDRLRAALQQKHGVTHVTVEVRPPGLAASCCT